VSTTINIGINLRDFNQGMNQVKGGLKGLGDTVGKAFAAVGAAVVGVGIKSLRAGEDANQALGAIAAQTGQTQGALRETEEAIRDLSVTQGRFTAQEMREGLASVSRHGQDTTHQVHMVEAAMRLAKQSGVDFGSSIKNLDALMVKFNADLDDSIKFTNMFATAQGEAGISMDNLTKGLQRAAPITNQAGLSYEFVAASLSQAYLEGINMTNSSSGLTNIFENMLDPTSNLSGVISDLGIQTRYSSGEFRDNEAIMWDLARALDGLDEESRRYKMAQLGLTQYGTAMMDMFMNNGDAVGDLSDAFRYGMDAGYDYERALHAIEQRGGGFTEAFGLMRNMLRNILYAINDIIGARFYEWMGEATGKLGEFITQAKENGYIEKVAEAIMEIVEALINFVKEIIPVALEWLPKLIDLTIKVTQFLGENADMVIKLWLAFKGYKIVKSVIDIFEGLKKATGALKGKKAIGGLSPAMTKAVGTKGGKGVLGGAGKLLKALGPKGWAVAAIGAGAVATVGWFRQTDEEGNTRWSNMTESIGNHARNLRDNVSDRMSDLRDRATDRFSDMRDNARDHFDGMRDNVTERVSDMASTALKRFQNWTGLTDDEMRQARDNVTNAAREMRDNVVDRVTGLRDRGIERFKGVREAASKQFNSMRDTVTQHATTMRDNARERFNSMRESVSNTVNTIRDNVAERFSSMRDRAVQSATTLANNARNRIANSRIGEAASTVTDTVRSAFRTAGNQAVSWGRSIGDGVRNGIENTRQAIRNTVDSVGNMIGNAFRSVMGISSPSRVMTEYGQYTGQGIEVGLLNTVSDIEKASKTLANTTIDSMIGANPIGANTASPTLVNNSQSSREERQSYPEPKQPAIINVYLGGKQIAREIVDDITKEQNSLKDRRLSWR
jgi:TP901 family phage tail tape measure protein